MGASLTYTLTYTAQLVTDVCCVCGVAFAWPSDLRQHKLDFRNDRAERWFYCPNGHKQHFLGKTDAERERQARIRAEARAARAEDAAEVAERRRRAAKGQATKLRRRVANGVCPGCSRTFANVAAHVKNKHPDLLTEPAEV